MDNVMYQLYGRFTSLALD